MITDPPILTIRGSFQRPPADLVRSFAGASTGHLVDAMGGSGALHWQIKPLSHDQASFCGTALTCNCGPGDNLAMFGALEIIKPGDVLMAASDSYMGTAVAGDLLVGMTKNCGAAAFVTDGAVRDVAGILPVGLPVFCAGITPNSPVRNGPGAAGLPVVIGGVPVASGDIIVGDADGVVVVPMAIAAEVLKKLDLVRASEASLEANVKSGLRMPDFMSALLQSDRVERLS
jgi:4-hydroxy-4-methyl-2-oxoglutarate aldolase